MAAVQTYHGSRADVRTRTPRNGDPDAFYRYSGCGGNVAGEGSFTDSAVGLESFGYDRSQNQHIPKKGHDLDRSRTSSSPASPVPPGGFYHTKHFLPPFPECNGFSHQNIPQAQPIKPSSAHKASRLRHKQLDKQYPHEGKQILSQNFMNPDFYSQDCVHCDQERKLFENAHHQYHQTQLTHHQHQLYNLNTNHTLQQPNHRRSKTPITVHSSSLEDLDLNRSNDSLARAEYTHRNRQDMARHGHRTGNTNIYNSNNNNNNNIIYSCSSSSPERVYYPHSDSTPTSTPTSHLSSDAAAVTSVNIDSNISTSSITSHENHHNRSNSSSCSRSVNQPGQTSTLAPSVRPISTTPKAAGLEAKHRTFVMTSADIHSSHGEDKKNHCIDQTHAKSAPALDQSESQVSRSSSSPANQILVNGNMGSNENFNAPHSKPDSKSTRPESKDSLFENLPYDLLLKIFSHLPTDHLCKCAEVCQRWYNAVWDHPSLWTSIVINNSHLDINRALKYLTRRLSYNTPKVCMILEKININGCSKLTDRGLQTVVKRCPELRCLDMTGCVLVTNAGVTEAVSRCVNLERLDVTGCPLVTCISLTDSALTCGSARHLQRIFLRYLDMSDCPSVGDGDLLTVSSQCTQLLFLYLRRCPLISDLGVSYIAANCGSLREVSMSDCRNVTDLGMRELAKLGENLRYLSVAKCEKVSDHGVSHIALNCPKLRYLNVRGCEAVSDRGLELLARSCLRLRSLDVGKCDVTDAGLYALSTYCPQLRKLGLKSCDGVTDRGLVLVAYRCPQLRQLHVQDCSRLTSEAYSMVRRYCKGAFIEHTNPGVL